MRRLALISATIVVALAVALGWTEAQRSRTVDPPEPIARRHAAAIAVPILAAARTKGWRREARARVPLVTSEGDDVVYRRIPIEDRSGECVGVVVMAAGQMGIQEIRLSVGGRGTRPEDWYWEEARQPQLVMTAMACHQRPLDERDILRAMTGSWTGPCSPYDDCPGPDELRGDRRLSRACPPLPGLRFGGRGRRALPALRTPGNTASTASARVAAGLGTLFVVSSYPRIA